jgi:predicted enzyme related to lactoylglutathione lyase
MEKVTGIGGVFIKAKDPKAMAAWYEKHLGVDLGEHLYKEFKWVNENNPNTPGATVFSFFKEDSTYFDPGKQRFMINFRVKNLDSLLENLANDKVQIVGEPQKYDYGKFAWIMDPEGNKIELWEPVD